VGLLSPLRQSLNALVPGLPLADLLLGEVRKFDHGFVFEIVDLAKNGKPIRTKSLVLNPQRYNLSEPFTSTLTPSEDNTVVAEENGVIIREITIEGTTGLQKRKESALGRGGAIGTEASGVDHFRDLRDLFREYGRLKVDPERGPNIRMLFHNVLEDDHYVVVPRAFETPRDAATNRVHFTYRITLAAIQTIPAPKPPGNPFGFLGEFGDTLQAISEGVNDSRAFFVDSINEIEALRRRVQLVGDIVAGDFTAAQALDRIFESHAECINAAHDLVDGSTTSILLQKELWKASLDLEEDFRENILNNIFTAPSDDDLIAARTLRDTARSMTNILFRGNSFFLPPPGEDAGKPYAGERNFTDQDLTDRTAGATQGSRVRAALGSERRAGLNLGSYSGSERHTIVATDTLDNLALGFRVPREAIIDINNLKFPYIAAGGGPGVRSPGDSIVIPVRTPTTNRTPGPSNPFLTPEEVLYGSDLALDRELAAQGIFDIVVDTAHGSDDADLVRGVANVIQGVLILINTERGTTDFLADLGIRQLVGGKATLDRLLDASVALREAILGDDRISGIDSIALVLDGDVLSQEVTAILARRRDDAILQIPLGTVRGE
jgi:hypothetical protein